MVSKQINCPPLLYTVHYDQIPLTADIKHLEVKSFEGELCFDDSRCLNTGSQHVLLRWDVVWGGNPGKRKQR